MQCGVGGAVSQQTDLWQFCWFPSFRSTLITEMICRRWKCRKMSLFVLMLQSTGDTFTQKFMYLHISDYLFTFCISISLMLLSNVIQITTCRYPSPFTDRVPFFAILLYLISVMCTGGKVVKNSEVCA